jgi:hypothetical protein
LSFDQAALFDHTELTWKAFKLDATGANANKNALQIATVSLDEESFLPFTQVDLLSTI